MIEPLPGDVRSVLRAGGFCYVASRSGRWPHLTPVTYAVHASRLWVTTARRSVKGRAWKRDPWAAGLVGAGDRRLTFAGPLEVHDLLDPGTWARSALHAPRVTLAAAEFARRNARFFAGYAVDASHIPLAWTPPGRVFAALGMERAALLGDEPDTWGPWPNAAVRSRSAFEAAGRDKLLEGVPDDVRERIGARGDGALALRAAAEVTVLPARWAIRRGALLAVLATADAELAGARPESPAALVADHASAWRARAMTGVLARGTARVHVVRRLRRGRREAERAALDAGLDAAEATVLQIEAERLVWWRGWASGTVRR